MIISKYAHDQLKARSRSTQVTLTMSSRYAHDQLKISSRSAQSTVTISSKSTPNQVFASCSRWALLRQTYLYAYCVLCKCWLVLTGTWLNSTALHSTACYMFRLLPDNTRHSQQTNIHAPGGIRTHDLSSWAACGRSPAEILGSNPTGGMDICLLWVSCVVR